VVEVVVGLELVVVTVDVEEVEEVEEVQVTFPSSPPPEQPRPAETGRAAFDVLNPIATDVIKNTKMKPTRTSVAFLVLSFEVEVDPVNIVLKYRSEIYLILLRDFKFPKRLNKIDRPELRMPKILSVSVISRISSAIDYRYEYFGPILQSMHQNIDSDLFQAKGNHRNASWVV